MTLRSRLLVASLVLALLPVAVLGFGIRSRVVRAVEAQHAERVRALADVIARELEREGAELEARLARIAEAAEADTRLRLALLGGDEDERAYLLDYAAGAMGLAGLDLLRVQDAEGRILSSGHYRNEFDRIDLRIPAPTPGAAGGAFLLEVPTPSGSMLAFARAHPLVIGGEAFALVGGTRVDARFVEGVSRGTGLTVDLIAADPTSFERGEGSFASAGPDAEARAASGLLREVTVPFLPLPGAAATTPSEPPTHASFVVSASDAPLAELRASVDRWLLLGSAAAAALAFLLAAAFSAQLSRPLAALARRAERIDWERLDVGFPTRRLDEVGQLARVLDRMTGRLRQGAARLREAERRATTGEIARQVHHDVKNGLVPIRNVLAHLGELARDRPGELPAVYLERQRTLDSGVQYLQSLATSYARLAPATEKEACDVNRTLLRVAEDARAGLGADPVGVTIATDLSPSSASVHADPVALRRIAENLVTNALDSLGEGGGRVLVWSRPLDADGPDPRVQLGVSDSGRGMTEEERARAFDDFFTTKASGTGLGLSIVRRLVGDLGGRIHVESAPGEGTRFTVELPACP